jgi:folate-dependent tRNA-U54 methylase TrmFO/GidA
MNFTNNEVGANSTLLSSSYLDFTYYINCMFSNNNYTDFGSISNAKDTSFQTFKECTFKDLKLIPDLEDTGGKTALFINTEGTLHFRNSVFYGP